MVPKMENENLRNTYYNNTNKFLQNKIRNQRYSKWTFIPKVMAAQFSQISNVFFLLVGITQCFNCYRISSPISSLGPWLFVLILTLIKEAVDDISRCKRDREFNNQRYQKLISQANNNETVYEIKENTINKLRNTSAIEESVTYQEVPCSSLKPGDIIALEKNQRIPADLIILKTINLDGEIFIRTDQLDGETDWKLRQSVKLTQGIKIPELFKIKVDFEPPSKEIYSFYGRISYKDEVEVLDLNNTMWMNTVLASGQVLGMVIYTGKENRAIMNTSSPKNKIGIFDMEVN
ncbi:hypothetical protein H311_04105, partial [Anncaliia algerae PRA109]